MGDDQQKLMSGAVAVPRVDDRYQLADRTGHTMGAVPLSTLQNMIKQGRLFRTDQVSKNGADLLPLGELAEFKDTFEEVLPQGFSIEGTNLRPKPELIGDVDPLALANLFARIYRQRSTGRLFVCRADVRQEKVVVFRQGVPVNAMSNIEEEWLGEVLIGQGLIDQASFDEAVEHRREKGARIGSALIHLEKISPRDLHRALSVQAMERLINVFKQQVGTFHWVPDETAGEEEILLFAGVRDIIETGLSAAYGAPEITKLLADYGKLVLRVEVPEELEGDLSDSDKKVLEVLGQGRPLSECLHDVAVAGRLTKAEARCRVLALMRFGAIHAADEKVRTLEMRLHRLQAQDYFRMLDVRRAATPEDVAKAFEAACGTAGANLDDEDSEAVARVRGRIRSLLARARDVLADTDQRDIYSRAVQVGLDYDQPEVRQRLRHEAAVSKGQAALGRQDYEGAAQAFSKAIEVMPDDPEVFVHLGWAQFLGSDQGAEAAQTAIREVERSLRLSGDTALAYLTIAKIHRLVGDLRQAENNLRRAIEIDPRNNEAQSELRTLFAREIGKKRGRGGPSVKLDIGSLSGGAGPVMVYSALIMGGLFYMANMMPGGATEWPDVGGTKLAAVAEGEMQDVQRIQRLRLDHSEEKIIEVAVKLGANEEQMASEARQRTLRAPEGTEITTKMVALERLEKQKWADIQEAMKDTRTVPAAEQVMGNVEYFVLQSDQFWWMRRGALLILGLLGIFLIARLRPSDFSVFGKGAWIAAAIPYGVVVGFLGATPTSPTPMWTLVGMASFQVVAEQIFFIGFLFFGLRKFVSQPGAAVAISAVAFGLYQLTYFAVLQSPPEVMIQDVMRIGAFAGAAYAGLALLSGGLLAPLLAHLALNLTTIIRAALGG